MAPGTGGSAAASAGNYLDILKIMTRMVGIKARYFGERGVI
jgi:hypothetical protein